LVLVWVGGGGWGGGGGGVFVGFYINNKFSFKKIDQLSCMEEKIMECLTVEICIFSKKILLTSMYHSPTNYNNLNTAFLNKFDDLLENLSNTTMPIFIDLILT
jgi:hypothetical protein